MPEKERRDCVRDKILFVGREKLLLAVAISVASTLERGSFFFLWLTVGIFSSLIVTLASHSDVPVFDLWGQRGSEVS